MDELREKIIVSINPEYVERIILGSKKYEYRTRIAKKNIGSLIIYETNPVKKIVGEVEVIDVLSMSPKDLWGMTREWSGITRAFFNMYFKGKRIAYAYKLGNVTVYDRPVDLCDYGLKSAPQSFVYLSNVKICAKCQVVC